MRLGGGSKKLKNSDLTCCANNSGGKIKVWEWRSYSLIIFIALFAMIFGAATAGSAAAFGPDVGKATVAARRIFSIIEHESTINALEMDKD